MVSNLCSAFRHALQLTRSNFKSCNGGVVKSMVQLQHDWNHSVCTSIRSISTTPYLLAEPLKKKKRLDPAIIKAREDRKKRKLEKQIRRLQKHERQLKPIEEMEVAVEILDNPRERTRRPIKLSVEQEEYRWLLEKKWSRYRFNVNAREIRMIDRMLCSQEKALKELRAVSEDLYQAAIQADFGYIPYEIKGPVETPPIEGYDPDEGDYFDISRKWD